MKGEREKNHKETAVKEENSDLQAVNRDDCLQDEWACRGTADHSLKTSLFHLMASSAV